MQPCLITGHSTVKLINFIYLFYDDMPFARIVFYFTAQITVKLT